jgi:hypothetical protein
LRLQIESLNSQTFQTLFSANGQRLRLLGTADVVLEIANLRIPHKIYICENLHEQLLLGRSFLSDAGAIINFRNQTISFNDTLHVELHHSKSKSSFVRAKEQICVPPNSEIVFNVLCHTKFDQQDVILTPIAGEQFRRFAVANSISRVDGKQTLCKLLNFTDKCLIIHAQQKIAQIEHFHNTQQCLLVSQHGNETSSESQNVSEDLDEDSLETFAKEFAFNINSELPRDIRLKLIQILYKRREAFARSSSELKTYNKQEFEIKMQNTKPMFNRQFKHKPEHGRILQQHINQWKAQKIVEPSNNFSFNSCIFLVPKSTLQTAADKGNMSHYRPVLDLRDMNSRVERYIIYTPSTHELIEEITKFSDDEPHQRSAYFSTFDFMNGYLQLSLKPGLSRESTSFTSPEGERLCFTKLPFGHHLSSAMFSSVMNRVFGPMRSRGSLCYYIDDCIIHTISAALHLEKIDEFLGLLIENDLKCSVAKSHLMATRIKYLGVCIDSQGIKVPPEITRTLDKLESAKLTTPKQVMALLGYFNFWKNHIANLAQRTYHLRQLTKKDTPFRFTTECQAERSDVINCLRSTNTLQAISPNEPLWCFVDSSYKGIGVTWAQTSHSQDDPKSVENELTQIRRGHPTLRPVLHQSWTIGAGQRSYGSTHLELFGLQKSIMAIEHLTTARVIHVVSDNVGVVALQKLKIGNARQRRLLAYLQLFDLRLHYCPGSKHISSDFLSRLSQINILSPGETIAWLAPDKEFLDEYLFAIHSEDKSGHEDIESQGANDYQYMQCARLLHANGNVSQACDCSKPLIADAPMFTSQASWPTSDSPTGPVLLDTTLVDHVTSDVVQTGDNAYLQTSSMNVHAQSFYPAAPTHTDIANDAPTYLSECNIALTPPRSLTPAVGQTSEGIYSGIDTMAGHQLNNASLPQHNQVFAVKRLRRNAATDDHTSTPLPTAHSAANDTSASAPLHGDAPDEPMMTAQDYADDGIFGPMWRYLKHGELTGEQTIDYRTLLMESQYVIENDRLYRLTLPRNKKRSADGAILKTVVIPKKFENAALTSLHEKFGHFAGQQLFDTARLMFYMPKLYESCFQVARTCLSCQQTKINRQKQIPALHPTPLFGPGKVFLIDFKVLPRRTSQGHTVILAMIDSYSGYPYFEPLVDSTALTTAKAIIRRILPDHPGLTGLISDKGPQFISNILKSLNHLLGCTHFHSASMQSQSHGQIERCILSLNQLIALYADDDTKIADSLPIIELSLRISTQKTHGYSPFEILRGYTPTLNLSGNLLEDNEPIQHPADYIVWLKERLKAIHNDVSQNVVHARTQQKAGFDQRNRVTQPDWTVGETVLLERGTPLPRSDQVLTHKRFGETLYYITKIVDRQSTHVPSDDNPYPRLDQTEVGPAYQLTNAKTGKILKHLVPSKRLKKFHDRAQFNQIHPPLPCAGEGDTQLTAGSPRLSTLTSPPAATTSASTPRTIAASPQPLQPTAGNTDWETALGIIRKRVVGGQLEFLVRFNDQSVHWCTEHDTSTELKRRFFIRQAAQHRRRQRSARAAFRND